MSVLVFLISLGCGVCCQGIEMLIFTLNIFPTTFLSRVLWPENLVQVNKVVGFSSVKML